MADTGTATWDKAPRYPNYLGAAPHPPSYERNPKLTSITLVISVVALVVALGALAPTLTRRK